MSRIYLYVWSTGLLGYGPTVPEGVMSLTHVYSDQALYRILAMARMGHGRDSDGNFIYLVPGMPEATTETERWRALVQWLKIAIHDPLAQRRRENSHTAELIEIQAEREASAAVDTMVGLYIGALNVPLESETSSDETDAV